MLIWQIVDGHPGSTAVECVIISYRTYLTVQFPLLWFHTNNINSSSSSRNANTFFWWGLFGKYKYIYNMYVYYWKNKYMRKERKFIIICMIVYAILSGSWHFCPRPIEQCVDRQLWCKIPLHNIFYFFIFRTNNNDEFGVRPEFSIRNYETLTLIPPMQGFRHWNIYIGYVQIRLRYTDAMIAGNERKIKH